MGTLPDFCIYIYIYVSLFDNHDIIIDSKLRINGKQTVLQAINRQNVVSKKSLKVAV